MARSHRRMVEQVGLARSVCLPIDHFERFQERQRRLTANQPPVAEPVNRAVALDEIVIVEIELAPRHIDLGLIRTIYFERQQLLRGLVNQLHPEHFVLFADGHLRGNIEQRRRLGRFHFDRLVFQRHEDIGRQDRTQQIAEGLRHVAPIRVQLEAECAVLGLGCNRFAQHPIRVLAVDVVAIDRNHAVGEIRQRQVLRSDIQPVRLAQFIRRGERLAPAQE